MYLLICATTPCNEESTMKSQFVEQVQLLMEIQHLKYTEYIYERQNNYMWLCTRKPPMVYWMSTKDEIKIRNCLSRITQEQEIIVLKQVLTYLDRNPNVSSSKVPEMTIYYLNELVTANCFKQAQKEATQSFSRMASLRNSLRKLSVLGNRSILSAPAQNHEKQRRSVTFDEVPTVYRISVHK